MESNNKSSPPVMENNSPVKIYCNTHTKLIHLRYCWTIQNFSLRPEENGTVLKSSEFSAGRNDQSKWQLHIYPKGIDKERKDYVSLYLFLASYSQSRITANFMFSLVNSKGDKINRSKTAYCFTNKGSFGFPEFIKQDFLLNKDNNLLPDDYLTIICEITIASETVHSCRQSMVKSDVPKSSPNEAIGSLFNNSKLSDLKFAIDDKEIPAHKCILAAHSEVFAAMFEHDMEEAKSNRVVITDIDYEVFSEMLHFIYTGKAPKLYGMSTGLLIAADKYALEWLKLMCEEAISANLSIETASETLVLADLHYACQLKLDTLDFMSSHMGEVIETEGWQNMLETHLIKEVVRAYVQKNNDLRKNEIKN